MTWEIRDALTRCHRYIALPDSQIAENLLQLTMALSEPELTL